MAEIKKLTDESEMPYGKFKGIAMNLLDASYLLWLYDNGSAHLGVREYVEENLSVFRNEVQSKAKK